MEQFKDLEKKIRLAAERIQHLKAVRLELERQLAAMAEEQRSLKDRVAELEAGQAGQEDASRELDRLRSERSEIRQRVETLIGELAELELEKDRPPTPRAKRDGKKTAPAKTAAAGG
jgi:peptidoglycan hydrolase CwlO-like protein